MIGAISSRLLEPADEVAQAHAYAAGHRFELEVALEVAVQPLLCGGDNLVTVLGLQRDNGKAGLPGAGSADDQRLRGLQRDLMSAEFFNNIQAQVERRIHASATIKAAILSDHHLRHPLHLGIHLGETRGDGPVRRGAFAIE